MFKQLFLKFILILILELVSHATLLLLYFLNSVHLLFLFTGFWPNKYYRSACFLYLIAPPKNALNKPT